MSIVSVIANRTRTQLRLASAAPPALCAALAALVVGMPTMATTADADPPIELAVRFDDMGMCHSVNSAVRQVIASGIPLSTSVMIACPWYLEAAEILKDHPEIGVGIHLTLNSEWGHYKWGPVLGASRVPSLVDANGHFYASESEFRAAAVDPDEVRSELRAQIERALRAGLRIDYLDAHMLMAYATPELRAIVEDLAREFGLGIALYFGERSASLWDVAPEKKLPTLMRFVHQLEAGLNLLVIHPGLDTPEMAAMVDMNYAADPFRVSRHRQAEIDAITSPAFRGAVAARGIRLVTYHDIMSERGRDAMVRPADISGYEISLVEQE
jgi:predicted glycoside hydrolase/deacetylase ChbG (UPF0249 family)